MGHVLTDHGLCLTYLRNSDVIDDVDQAHILDDLSDDTLDGDPLPWLTRYRLDAYDHLVLVTDRSSDRHLGFLAASNGATPREDFLLLETAFVATAARGQNLMRRMLAFAMLRIGGMGPVPSIVAACTRSPHCYRIMRDTARRFSGATFFPEPDSVTIDFHAATLAQRIVRAIGSRHRFHAATGTIRGVGGARRQPISGDPQLDSLFGQHMQPADRVLTVLDLRGEDEATIFDDARRIYRSR